jgi:type IV pilus assembly protein PilW
MFRNNHDNKGLTLLELMVAIAVSSIVMGTVYTFYTYQTRSYNTQQLTVDMQEGLRVALELMQGDLRLAGSDRSGEADAGFSVAGPTTVTISMDITGGEDDDIDNNHNFLIDEADEWYDGDTDDPNESVTWSLNGTTLQRNNSAVAFNIQQLDLVYLDNVGNVLDDDGAGNVTTSLDQIKSVIITMIGGLESNRRVIRFLTATDQTKYTNQQGVVILDLSVAPNNIRKRVVSSQVYCRNMQI